MRLSISGRSSPLSRVQVEEVYNELRTHHDVEFDTTFVSTTGDNDQKTSLRTLDKTDFFTKEIDQLLLEGKCRIGIHSAKDLPDPLPDGLSIVAVTKGLDNSDSLVFLREPKIVATSSQKREENVLQLYPNAKFVDIRGTIGQRLEKLNNGEVDAVVIAEAALIRLGLTHLNRVKLPGTTTPGQGQLAVLAHETDVEMQKMFSCIDSRKRCLYLGLNVPPNSIETTYIHCPLIKIIPRTIDGNPDLYTHIIFTSQSSVKLFFDQFSIKDQIIISVGKKTSSKLPPCITAEDETSEGIVALLKQMDLTNAKILWPHSALSRSVIKDYLGDKCTEWILYDTVINQIDSVPDLQRFDEIMFTSPSTVDAFLHYYKELPKDKILTPIGQVTCAYLLNKSEWSSENSIKENNHAIEV